MAWNYRVMFDGENYTIGEMYYDDGGFPTRWKVQSVPLTGLTVSELHDTLDLMKHAFDKEVITI